MNQWLEAAIVISVCITLFLWSLLAAVAADLLRRTVADLKYEPFVDDEDVDDDEEEEEAA
jgi:hypothetical protein